MSDTLPILRRKIKGARDLQSVVRTMKAMAAATVGPCERAVAALADYQRNLELGLIACFRHIPRVAAAGTRREKRIGAVVFGTDQGMVGQFNERLFDFVSTTLPTLGETGRLWVVGERMNGRVEDAGLEVAALFETPHAVTGITPLISELLLAVEQESEAGGFDELHVFHNQPRLRASYKPVSHRLLPLDEAWRNEIEAAAWPTRQLPEIIAGGPATLDALIREFLFISIFRACAESLMAENARRFAAMQGAEKNIGELTSQLTLDLNRQRQKMIDEELFDLISGYEVLRAER